MIFSNGQIGIHNAFYGLIELFSEFIDDWVKIGLPAKIKVLKEHACCDPLEQRTLCEKVSSAAIIYFNSHSAAMLEILISYHFKQSNLV